MSKLSFSAVLFSMILFSACVTSLNPIVTYDRALTDDRLPGTWKSGDGQEFVIQPVLQSNIFKNDEGSPMKKESFADSVLLEKSYIFEYSKDKGNYAFLVSFIRLKDQLFMNCMAVKGVYSNNPGEQIDLDYKASIRTYTIARVEWKNSNSLKIDFIDGGFLYDQIKAGRMKIKHESDELYETFLITASTVELRQFIEKYGKDERFFNAGNSITLKRKS